MEWLPGDGCSHCLIPAERTRPKSMPTAANHRRDNHKKSVKSGLQLVCRPREMGHYQRLNDGFAQPYRPRQRHHRTSKRRFSPGSVSRNWNKTRAALLFFFWFILPNSFLFFNTKFCKCPVAFHCNVFSLALAGGDLCEKKQGQRASSPI